MIEKQSRLKKTMVILLIGLFLTAGIIPSMNSNNIKAFSTDDSFITVDIAATVALSKIGELGKTNFYITDSLSIHNGQDLLCYIFNLRPMGYIVVTGSYNLPPVIAYSFTNTYEEDVEGNPLYDLLFTDLKLRLQTITLTPESIIEERHKQWDSYQSGITITNGRFEQWPPEGSTPTGGWLLENWHQSPPYNNYCPLDIAHGGSRSVAGCPAVAMAQILNYHNTTMNVSFDDSDDYYHAYLGNNYWIDNNYIQFGFPSFPQLNIYLTTLQSHYEDHIPPTNDDKAALTFACGVAATQVYAASGSGTFGVDQAYDAYQRFNCTSIELLDENDPDLYERLSNNMKDALPAHLAVVNEGWTVGHNVVVDGYNTDEYYHINFGWGGPYNGWYLIPDELPYDLTVIEGLIVDILKNTAIPDLTCDGALEWTNVTPNETVTGSFTVSNIGEAGSNLDWEITGWPTWGEWTFTPLDGNNLKPEDGPTAVTAQVVVPNVENHLFTGQITITNKEDPSDDATVPVSLQTGLKTHEKLFCNGSLTWVDVKPFSTITGSFTVENIGAAYTNLSWGITSWPDWGTWTFTPSSGTDLTPEHGPVTINVSIRAPLKRGTQFSGDVILTNSDNSSDYDTVPVSLATPYHYSVTLLDILQAVIARFPHAFPLLRLLLA
ncbi:MAG: C10 family peptidase [Candidatus Thermoplasmatota archaeon]|nr:C10 family peptidase [Candidatus Thermoplasmatota archaeon]